MVMIGSNSRKAVINQLQSYHMGIQEKEERATECCYYSCASG